MKHNTNKHSVFINIVYTFFIALNSLVHLYQTEIPLPRDIWNKNLLDSIRILLVLYVTLVKILIDGFHEWNEGGGGLLWKIQISYKLK